MSGQARVQVAPTDIQLAPGGPPSSVRIEVFNGTNIVDQFWAGPLAPEAWLSGTPATINLYPEEQGSIEIALSIPAGRLVPAGTHPLTIRVASAATRQVILDRQIHLTVMPIVGSASMKTEPSELRGARNAKLMVEVTQTGNAPLAIAFSGEDAQGALRFDFAPTTVAVPPAGVAQSVCTVSARPTYFGEELTHRFTVHATGSQQPLQAAGVFHQSVVFAPNTVRLLAILLTMLGGAVVLLAVLLRALSWGAQRRGIDWNYWYYADKWYERFTGREGQLPQLRTVTNVLSQGWVSWGALVAVLAVLAIVGALIGKKRLARIPAALIVVIMIMFAISLHFLGVGPSLGVYLALLGGVIALIGSFLIRPFRWSVKIPKPRAAPKIPSPS